MLTFCLSLIIVYGEELLVFKSSFKVAKNHSQLYVDSTSHSPNAMGKIQSLGSTPTDVSKFPLYLVFMWHPSRKIIGLQALRYPLLHASYDQYSVEKWSSVSLVLSSKTSLVHRKNLLPGLVLLSSWP